MSPLSKIVQLYRGSQFVDGGNRRKPPTRPKSLPNFIASTPRMIVIRTHSGSADKHLLHMYI